MNDSVELLIIPVTEFDYKTPSDQKIIADELQNRCNLAGLKGVVVPVWANGDKTMSFYASPALHPFLENITLDWVIARLNKAVSWPD